MSLSTMKKVLGAQSLQQAVAPRVSIPDARRKERFMMTARRKRKSSGVKPERAEGAIEPCKDSVLNESVRLLEDGYGLDTRVARMQERPQDAGVPPGRLRVGLRGPPFLRVVGMKGAQNDVCTVAPFCHKKFRFYEPAAAASRRTVGAAPEPNLLSNDAKRCAVEERRGENNLCTVLFYRESLYDRASAARTPARIQTAMQTAVWASVGCGVSVGRRGPTVDHVCKCASGCTYTPRQSHARLAAVSPGRPLHYCHAPTHIGAVHGLVVLTTITTTVPRTGSGAGRCQAHGKARRSHGSIKVTLVSNANAASRR